MEDLSKYPDAQAPQTKVGDGATGRTNAQDGAELGKSGGAHLPTGDNGNSGGPFAVRGGGGIRFTDDAVKGADGSGVAEGDTVVDNGASGMDVERVGVPASDVVKEKTAADGGMGGGGDAGERVADTEAAGTVASGTKRQAPEGGLGGSDFDSENDDFMVSLLNPRPAPKPLPIPLQIGNHYKKRRGTLYAETAQLCSLHQDSPKDEKQAREVFSVHVSIYQRADAIDLHALITAPLWAALKGCEPTGLYVMTCGQSQDLNWETRAVKLYFATLESANEAVRMLNSCRNQQQNSDLSSDQRFWKVRHPNGTKMLDPSHPSKQLEIAGNPPFFARGHTCLASLSLYEHVMTKLPRYLYETTYSPEPSILLPPLSEPTCSALGWKDDGIDGRGLMHLRAASMLTRPRQPRLLPVLSTEIVPLSLCVPCATEMCHRKLCELHHKGCLMTLRLITQLLRLSMKRAFRSWGVFLPPARWRDWPATYCAEWNRGL